MSACHYLSFPLRTPSIRRPGARRVGPLSTGDSARLLFLRFFPLRSPAASSKGRGTAPHGPWRVVHTNRLTANNHTRLTSHQVRADAEGVDLVTLRKKQENKMQLSVAQEKRSRKTDLPSKNSTANTVSSDWTRRLDYLWHFASVVPPGREGEKLYASPIDSQSRNSRRAAIARRFVRPRVVVHPQNQRRQRQAE